MKPSESFLCGKEFARVCVCVCVCERERDSQRGYSVFVNVGATAASCWPWIQTRPYCRALLPLVVVWGFTPENILIFVFYIFPLMIVI